LSIYKLQTFRRFRRLISQHFLSFPHPYISGAREAMTPGNPNPNAPQEQSKSVLKNPYVYSSILILVVACYVGYILFSRHESNREYVQRNAAKQAERQHEQDQKDIEQLGGSDLAIRSMYVSPTVIHHGESAQLCYDVANAKTVTLDPPDGEVWPSHSRCVNLSPKKTTTYTLSIQDAAGQSASQSVDLKVE
jgi:H+/gluconate symporter-like permease